VEPARRPGGSGRGRGCGGIAGLDLQVTGQPACTSAAFFKGNGYGGEPIAHPAAYLPAAYMDAGTSPDPSSSAYPNAPAGADGDALPNTRAGI